VDRLNQQLPDPVIDSLRSMQREIERLQEEVRTLQNTRESEKCT
jgi:serine O-acetyltransferase